MTPSMITLSDVRFSYDGRAHTVFDALSLDIPTGSVTAVLGPNGAGKSTLLHLILGALAPQSGSVHLDRRPRPSYTQREMGRLVGLVAQSETIPFNFTVLEYVLLGRAPHLGLLEMPHAGDVHIAQEALAQVGIAEMAGRSVQALSGGERQLVLIARALAQQPRILLLDEPTAHLDLGNKGRVLTLARQLANAGVTAICTTHEPDLVAAIADYVVLMRAGQALAAGPVETVFTSENLSQTYDTPVQVTRVNGRRVALADYCTL
ncbi:MAG: ABC transporter ATP-binding protein [Anaerolineae bacterium]|nr:ABC transporter ATP-binding protein [Anaerolineae bacterium]